MDDFPAPRRVFVCSPLGAPTKEGVQKNIARAQRLCLLAMTIGDVSPFAPHAFFSYFLDDSDPEERELGIQAGQDWLETADELWAFTKNGISGGMREEIELARKFSIPVVMDPECFDGVDG